MATDKQLAANRRNAQKSTGPKTPEGRATVSKNRMIHGLRGKFGVVEELEKQENFDALRELYIEELQPNGQVQLDLVEKMAESTWLSARASRGTETCFVLEPKTPEQKKSGDIPVGIDHTGLQRFLRYQAAHDRAYQRAAAELRKLKEAERLAEIGFERQKRQQAEEARKAEKHKLAISVATMRTQREEMRLGDEIAKMLPPDFTLDDLNSVFGTAARPAISPALHPMEPESALSR
jgi:hypothetical protein